ncbi:DUF4269 domain-containing protein [Aquimarina gracilis]|uniref:DUF4269 domain-containing protein n=1 Tax=Aquimarina gracilis TaxID=874422 RepID=A0ABU5ZWC3_9FLAO|nr:DUF4269 domain-containing protein [Aquimarina gracilis]MEB3346147.1 DUF4269 domain-containing protein [Aquimarina gracilis]
MFDFGDITYLKSGSKRQQEAYRELTRLNVFEHLKNYDPILTGTIPIQIDVPKSDLDIICQCKNHIEFSSQLCELFGHQNDFKIRSYKQNEVKSTVVSFIGQSFKIEIFGQDIPTKSQHAYRHMVIEYELLNQKGEDFRARVRKLKQEGYKTEPAFAKLLGLEGDPYSVLLNVKV